jgi:hypothetical protein
MALTRLPMGHPLAPYVLQRLAAAVAQHINHPFGTAMVAYSDDWLLFQPDVPAAAINRTEASWIYHQRKESQCSSQRKALSTWDSA